MMKYLCAKGDLSLGTVYKYVLVQKKCWVYPAPQRGAGSLPSVLQF